jgi:hypothetical protein
MAKSWSGFTPQNLSIKKEWKFLELSQALAPDMMVIPAEPAEEEINLDESEDLSSALRAIELKASRHRH